MRKDSARRVVGLVLREGLAAPLSDGQLLQAYLRDRSTEAFTEIVRRFGPMVFGVYRRMLAHDQDAEDAFQATFLVLARKAGAVRPAEALGRWLYGVAFRNSQIAKTRRHRERERRSALALESHPHSTPPSEPVDWLALMDQEINRLSERDRLTIVLCDLMGRSRKEAAEDLGLSEGTLSSRLARARERLRTRLERRGVVPAIAAGCIADQVCAAPGPLIESTSTAAPTAVSPSVALLARGVARSMFMSAMTKVLSVVIGLSVATGFVVWFGSSSGAKPVTGSDEALLAATVLNENEEPSNQKTDQELIQGLGSSRNWKSRGRRPTFSSRLAGSCGYR